jgi:hypothetical protein
MHCALPPSEPPDGERPCCFCLAAIGGAQLRGGWHLSAIARLQGFSSGSPTASPHQWSPRTVTTSSMVGRSKPGCSLCPALSFKDLHHPCWGGGRGEPGLPSRGLASRFFLRLLGWKPSSSSAEEASPSHAREGELLLPSQRAAFCPLSGRRWPAASGGVSQHVVRREGSTHVLGRSHSCFRGEDGSEDLPVRFGAASARWCDVGG